ncbi:MAG: phosphatase PAP2 family protein [Oscillospiraceae bacterium]|nr:phosphatase PAP2 family protein [Oscillospiraceae bacterium]
MLLLGMVIACCVLMLGFMFVDLPIALWIYNADSAFGRFFEIIGTLPMPVVGIFSCVAWLLTCDRRRKVGTALNWVFGVLFLAYFIFYAYRSFANALPEGRISMLIVMLLWLPASVILSVRLIKSGKRAGLRRAAVIGVAGCGTAVFGPMLLKEFMSRPRFNMLDDPVTEFTYWFARQPHTALSVNSSFPSGHAAQAATSMAVLLIPLFAEKYNTRRFYLIAMCASIGFTLCVMLSRMVLGMHYATDVITGAALTAFAMTVTFAITERTAGARATEI